VLGVPRQQHRRGPPGNLSARSIQLGHSRRTKFAAVAAPHTRAEGWHRSAIWPVVHIHRALMAAVLARHEQAADAVLAPSDERHWADWFVIPGHADQLRTDREQNQGGQTGSRKGTNVALSD
jgi:hypothetical protein